MSTYSTLTTAELAAKLAAHRAEYAEIKAQARAAVPAAPGTRPTQERCDAALWRLDRSRWLLREIRALEATEATR